MDKQELIEIIISNRRLCGYELGPVGIMQVANDVADLLWPLVEAGNEHYEEELEYQKVGMQKCVCDICKAILSLKGEPK